MKLLMLACLSVLSAAHGYRILCMFPVPTRSHNILGKGIADALLIAGHEFLIFGLISLYMKSQVTYVTPYPDIMKPAKGLRIVDVSETTKIFEGLDIINTATKGDFRKVLAYGREISTVAIQNQRVQDILGTENFDGVVSEWFFSDVNAGLAATLQAPWILLSGTVMSTHMESLVDDIRTTAIIPGMLADFPIPMGFLQRLANTFMVAGMTFGTWLDQADNEALYQTLWAPIAARRGVPLPAYSDALYNVSILLSNSHPSMSPAQSLPPNVVQIAGYHIDKEIPPLPKDLQDLLDGSPNGVVYFSMGSVVKSSALPADQRADLIRVLGELPYTVLWKFEEAIEGLPKNVHVRAWMPQPSILAHPNVKLFITHGGMLSTLEALNAGVPLLAIPVYGDQNSNANRAVRAGYALRVPFRPWSAAALKEALAEILGNDKYYKTAKQLSKVFHSRPVEPSKLISHYVEIAIETKGAYHLRSASRHYKWYERYMLDQLAVVLLVLYILKKIISIVFKTLINLFTMSKKDNSVKKVGKPNNKKKVKAQ